MRVISINELRALNRTQLFSLLTQLQAVLADLPEGSTERTFVALTLANIRAVLVRKVPAHTP